MIHPTRIKEGSRLRGNLTEAGVSLASARATKRVPKSKASAVFERFLSACEAVNRRDDLPFRVDEVWLFGSLLNPDKEDVGDIDFVPVIGSTKLRPGTETHSDWYWDLARELGLMRQITISNHYELVQSRILYGGRRHSLFAPTDLYDLTSLACPCQLVFDIARGGRVDDPVRPMHPDAKGRHNSIGLPKRMPSLEPTGHPIVPVAASMIVPEFSPTSDTRQAYCLGGECAGKIDLYAWHDSFRTLVVADGIVPPEAAGAAYLKHLDLGECDDRRLVGLLVSGEGDRDGCGLTLERRIERVGDGVRYDFEVQQYVQSGSERIERCFDSLTFALHAILQADLERIFRLDAEAGIDTRLEVQISSRSEHPTAIAIADELGILEDVVVWAVADRTGHEPNCHMPRWTDEAPDEPTSPTCR